MKPDEEIGIKKVVASAYKIPTQSPEADGTIKWNSTTFILVSIEAADKKGIGYSYADGVAASFINHNLSKIVEGKNPLQISSITDACIKAIRNNGNCGLAMMAVSAVDNALWDLKAKLFNIPVCDLLGKARESILIYGSGGFTNYSSEQLQQQFGNWRDEGIQYMKMKIGSDPSKDVQRVSEARQIIGSEKGLFVDANGAYTVKQALDKAAQFEQFGVSWFEEPVTSDNLSGLKFIRERVPPGMNVAAGEYGSNLPYFNRMLNNGSVDVLQADATRCGGISNYLKAGYLAEAHQIPFSSHCAPWLHLHASLHLPSFYISEYFFDHVRIEKMIFDGIRPPENGYLKPNPDLPGLGLIFKEKDAEKYKI